MLTVILLICKFTVAPAMSFWIVFFPILLPLAVLLALGLVVLFIAFVALLLSGCVAVSEAMRR
jgi:hypothetical protein